jgi:MoxR-like ATPase
VGGDVALGGVVPGGVVAGDVAPDLPPAAESVPEPQPVELDAPPAEVAAASGVAAPAAADAVPVVAPAGGDGAPREPAAAGAVGPAFVDVATVRAAGVAAGLRLPAGVYASIAAALGTGKHLLLTGAPGSGKTQLALAVARAAAQEGRARGATVVTGDASRHIVEAAAQGRWVVVDELDPAAFEAQLAPLSTFLGGTPVTFPDGEATPAEDWRLIATWNGSQAPRAAILRRFAVIMVHPPASEELRAALQHAANHDAAATAAAERLTHYTDRVGTGVLLEAARHAAARQAATPTDPDTLTNELIAAYIAPLIEP